MHLYVVEHYDPVCKEFLYPCPAVSCNQDRILQVLINLLDNAIKFAQEKGRIRIETRRRGGNALVVVRDNGIGIARQQLPKVFMPFSQIGDAMTRKGTGLGLAVSKNIVGMHGGKIWAKSAGKGKGATFYFTLPLKNNTGKG